MQKGSKCKAKELDQSKIVLLSSMRLHLHYLFNEVINILSSLLFSNLLLESNINCVAISLLAVLFNVQKVIQKHT